jgi:hypothetical protein
MFFWGNVVQGNGFRDGPRGNFPQGNEILVIGPPENGYTGKRTKSQFLVEKKIPRSINKT